MIRGLGVRGAVAINTITMVGIGPLVTIPLVLENLHGSYALAGWVVGALIALCDGLIWAELGARFPGSGGTYRYLRVAFGSEGAGKMLGFLFVWQFVLSAPLLLASGYIGFAQYATYLWPALGASANAQGLLASLVGIATIGLLYRNIVRVGAIGLGLFAVAVGTLLLVIVAAAVRFVPANLVPPHDAGTGLGGGAFAGLGAALLITLYDYAGYNDVCFVGDEVLAPARTIPRAIVIAIALVFVLYLALQTAIIGAIPWHELVPAAPGGPLPQAAQYVASTIVERAWGASVARVATVLVLIVAFASTFGLLLGMSRIPYAAARDGAFFEPFGRLHPTQRFPTVSLVTIGLLALPASFLSLSNVIAALTAGIVIVQSLAQIAAVVALRRSGSSPFRMWLYPVPLVVAFCGWSYIFGSAGAQPIAFGLLTLAAGVVVYLVRAKVAAWWPFAARASGALVLVLGALAAALPARAAAAGPLPAYGVGRVAERAGGPVFEVAGRPFFMYGAAFFYERLPRERWRPAMLALRDLGINTLDLYVPWNWHEVAEGDFDFEGRTNPRRDLREVLRLADELGFYLVVRPGPVVRNEWRNGGYPQWLLERPEYGMPLRDVLEGRYPATATLQNAHSDDAAAQWLRNTTHLRYARRWLERALHEFDPVAGRVLAVALDDDQGAYIDNQTWPAPHFQAYLSWLRGVVHGVTGPRVPVFINTYQMKVTASAPVWAMGNWYQSDTYAIAEHDRSQLEFSTGLLQTRPHQPLWVSEFQAGWLQQPQAIVPQPADPSNTELALYTMLGLGVRGVVNFPAQDTYAPAGWEAPFSNAFYGWDAALTYDLHHSPRYAPTRAFGAIVQQYGPELAAAHPAVDATIAALGSAFEPATMTNADFGALADRIVQTQRACRLAGLTCRLVDLRYASDAALARGGPLLLARPHAGPLAARPFAPAIAARLRRLAAGGVTIANYGGLLAIDAGAVRRTLARTGAVPVLSGAPGATYSALDDRRGFLSVANYDTSVRHLTNIRIHIGGQSIVTIPQLDVAARSGAIVPVGFPARLAAVRGAAASPVPFASGAPAMRADPALPDATEPVPPHMVRASVADVYHDGEPVVVLQNALVRVILSPSAGGRAFVFEDLAHGTNAFTTVGALRDDVETQPPASPTDRIAKYTHQFPAGFFNRSYRFTTFGAPGMQTAHSTYDAPDAYPLGGTFARNVVLHADARRFDVSTTAQFPPDPSFVQRDVVISSIAVGDPHDVSTRRLLPSMHDLLTIYPVTRSEGILPNVTGLYDLATHEAIVVASSAALATTADARSLVVTAVAPARLTFLYEFVDAAKAIRDANDLGCEVGASEPEIARQCAILRAEEAPAS